MRIDDNIIASNVASSSQNMRINELRDADQVQRIVEGILLIEQLPYQNIKRVLGKNEFVQTFFGYNLSEKQCSYLQKIDALLSNHLYNKYDAMMFSSMISTNLCLISQREANHQ
jgi:hypothetical protein